VEMYCYTQTTAYGLLHTFVSTVRSVYADYCRQMMQKSATVRAYWDIFNFYRLWVPYCSVRYHTRFGLLWWLMECHQMHM